MARHLRTALAQELGRGGEVRTFLKRVEYLPPSEQNDNIIHSEQYNFLNCFFSPGPRIVFPSLSIHGLSVSASQVRHRVESILNKDQIKHLKKQELWPDGADAFGGVLPAAGPGSGTPREGWGDAIGTGGDGDAAASTATENANKETEESTKAFGSTKKGDAGGVEEDLVTGVSRCCVSDAAGDNEEGEEEEEEEEEEDDMSDLFVNNNRAAMMQLRRDHEDDESESESESASDDDEAGR